MEKSAKKEKIGQLECETQKKKPVNLFQSRVLRAPRPYRVSFLVVPSFILDTIIWDARKLCWASNQVFYFILPSFPYGAICIIRSCRLLRVPTFLFYFIFIFFLPVTVWASQLVGRGRGRGCRRRCFGIASRRTALLIQLRAIYPVRLAIQRIAHLHIMQMRQRTRGQRRKGKTTTAFHERWSS